MKRVITQHPILCLLALAIGILSTLAYDLPLHLKFVPRESATADVLWAVALPPRLVTYAVFFVTFPMLAEQLEGHPRREVTLFWAWSLPAVFLALLIWALLASGAPIYYTVTFKRFIPGMMAGFAPGYSLAEVALWSWRAALYSWPTAIGGELLALILIPAALVRYTRRVAEDGRLWRALFTPVRGVGLVIVYALVVGWSYRSISTPSLATRFSAPRSKT